MQQPVVMVGVGEMGGGFARGFLRLGHPVYPVTRDMNIKEVAHAVPDPALVLITVAEKDLHPVLETIPEQWHNNLGLVQNELLPRDWQSHGIEQPTVISVWFEKKKGQDFKVIIPSPVFGPRSQLIKSALETLGIPCNVLGNDTELLYELVRKNVYILTTNIAGLETGGTVQTLWSQHQEITRQVANNIIDIQERLIGITCSRDQLINGMVEAFNGDPNHACMGRSAPARLARAIETADQFELQVPKLRQLKLRYP